MNATLLRMDVRATWKLFLVLLAVLMIYFVVISSLYNPDDMGALDNMMSMLPAEVIDAFGMGNAATTYTTMIANYFYGFIVLLFPTIWMIVSANGVVAKHVDRGSMANLLSTPHSRWNIAGTQAGFIVGSMTALLALFSLLGLAAAQALFPGALDAAVYGRLNLSVWLTFFALSGICLLYTSPSPRD